MSAKTPEALREQVERVRAAGYDPADVAYTLARRDRFEHRAVVLGDEVITGSGNADRVVFVFPGQGPQWAGMAEELLESPVFAARMRECVQALKPHVQLDLRETERVDLVQPALWAVMVSLAALWRAHGVEPAAVIGHSQGEIAAAVVSGALSLEDGARVVALRSKALRQLSGQGGMAVVTEPVDLPDGVSVAAVNGPANVVVSGDVTALAQIPGARRVPVDYASHSPHVEVLRDRLLDDLAGITPMTARIPLYSTVTADALDTSTMDADYWYRNLRETVLFEQAVRAAGPALFVEVSPHPVLVQALDDAVGTLRRDDGGVSRFQKSLAELHVRGVDVDWPPVNGQLVDLPTYPFQRERYWLDASLPTAGPDHPLLDGEVELADGGLVLTGKLAPEGWLAEHVVLGTTVFPGAGLLELALEAAQQIGCELVEELTLQAPLVLNGRVTCQVKVGPDEDGSRTISIHSRTSGTWTTHATGFLTNDVVPDGPVVVQGEPVDLNGFYDRLVNDGVAHGPSFQGLRAVWRHGEDVYAEVTTPADVRGYGIHPALLDAALHAMVAGGLLDSGDAPLPFAWSKVRLHATEATSLQVRLSRNGNGIAIHAIDQEGNPVVSVGSLVSRPVRQDQLRTHPDALYRVDWVPAAGVPATADLDARGMDVHAVLRWLQDNLTTETQLLVRSDDDLVSGLLRTVQAEHPDRFVHVDSDAEVLVVPGEPHVRVRDGRAEVPRLAKVRVTPEPVLGPDDRVLVTGASGTLGGLVARHLHHEHGVRDLVLVSRKPAHELADELGAVAVACDVSVRDALAAVLREHPPTAVIHTAAVLADATIESMTADQLDAVLGPKAHAAQHLHELTGNLKAFVLFGSSGSILGGPGQGNYTAAAAFLDGLARRRRGLGLPAVSLAWGLWERRSGLTGATDFARLRRGRMLPLSTEDGLRLFDAALSSPDAVLAPMRLDLTPGDDVPPLFRGLVRAQRPRAADTVRLTELPDVLDLVRTEVATVLGHIGADRIDPRKAFTDFGFDSLTAVDLRNRLNARTGLRLPVTTIFDYPSPIALAERLLGELVVPAPTRPDDIESATDDELFALIRDEFGRA